MIRVLTDFKNCPDELILSDSSRIRITRAATFKEMISHLRETDIIVINGATSTVFKLALHFLLKPWSKKPLVAVDLVLRIPITKKQRIFAVFKRFLLLRVDHFIHYFKDLRGYNQYYGISDARSSYIPFKVNIWGTDLSTLPLAEEYIFTLGISQRDYDTFIRAVSLIPYPAAMPEFSFKNFENRGTNFQWAQDNLPKNLRLLRDQGSKQDLIHHLARAKLVVIPTLRTSLCASGISTYLDAMYLKKCVILSEGPGASDLLKDQAILVPPEDPKALARAIQKLWEETPLRESTAEAGNRYARALGNESDLILRVIEQSCLQLKS